MKILKKLKVLWWRFSVKLGTSVLCPRCGLVMTRIKTVKALKCLENATQE